MARTSDGGRGREYRWRGWFIRIFGWDCAYFLTPAVLNHKVYARWACNVKDRPMLGFIVGRNEDGEWGLDIGLGRLLQIESSLPEYAAHSGSRGGSDG